MAYFELAMVRKESTEIAAKIFLVWLGRTQGMLKYCCFGNIDSCLFASRTALIAHISTISMNSSSIEADIGNRQSIVKALRDYVKNPTSIQEKRKHPNILTSSVDVWDDRPGFDLLSFPRVPGRLGTRIALRSRVNLFSSPRPALFLMCARILV